MENLVFEGFKFMALGMGTVFTFLALMIIAMNIQAYIIHKFFPEPVAAAPKGTATTANNKNAKVAAMSAAIKHHENVKG
jgi:oxaloacetate decarboxylase gamma subunit